MKFDDYLKEILVITNKRNLYDISNIHINKRNDISQKISYLLTNTNLLTEKLENCVFNKGYNFKKELNLLLTNFYNTYSTEIKIANIHYLYIKYLGRCCDYNSLKEFISQSNQNLLQLTLQTSIEKECVDWKNSDAIYLVNYYYITLLNYLPNEIDLKFLFTLKDEINFKFHLLDYIKSKNDYVYIEECRFHFDTISNTFHPKQIDKIKIKYYGAVGTSGYANITKNIIISLVNDKRFDIYFKVLQFQNYNKNNGSGNELLSSLSKKHTEFYDYIIIHSTPEYFKIISQIERNINPNVIIYGITVWETEKLPNGWEYYCKFVDKISVPSQFSSIAFKDKVLCDIVHHPIFIKDSNVTGKCLLFDIKYKYSYIFYNISEWTNRKGIDDLIDVFLDLYGNDNKFLLYIKTFGDISKEEGYKYILDLCKIKNIIFLDNIILDYNRVSSSYINCIHDCANCYVSFTRSEGQGLGLCYSALNGNKTIVTKYSGHIDYLKEFKGIYYVNYKLIPATFCCSWSSKHKKCQLLPYCSFFDKFTPSNQSWAQVNKLHAKEIMLKISKSKDKIKQNINPFTSEKFCNDIYQSLISTIKTKTEFIKNKEIGKTLDYFPQTMYIDWKIKKKLIGILNCGVYGNVGDYSYSFIIKEYLNRSDYELIFINDQHGKDKQDIIPIDYLIIGGGGLLNLERLHHGNRIWEYQNYCIVNKIPYYLLSLGFQDTDLNGKNIDKLKNYASLLDNSNFISVRSFPDYMIACSMIKNETKEFLHVYSDLVYSLDNFIPFKEFKRNILLVVLDNNWITLNNEYIRNDINQRMYLNKNLKLVFIDFAGISLNNSTNINNNLINMYFPNSRIVNGLKTIYSQTRNSTLNDIVEILCKSHTVISGRLHSYILSKVYKVPNIENYNYNNYKVSADKFSNLNNDTAIIPLKTIDYYINHDIRFTSKNWTENDRNDSIVRLHQKTNISIEHIQNWGNRQIEEKLVSLD